MASVWVRSSSTAVRIADARRTAVEDDRTQTLAMAKNIPLQFFDAETVLETLGRDRSVALRLKDYLQAE